MKRLGECRIYEKVRKLQPLNENQHTYQRGEFCGTVLHSLVSKMFMDIKGDFVSFSKTF